MKITHDVIDLRYIDKAFGIQLNHIGKGCRCFQNIVWCTCLDTLYLDRAEYWRLGKDDDKLCSGGLV